MTNQATPGEGAKTVPRHPTEDQVSEILHNINRKRRPGAELSASDVLEVVDNLFYAAAEPMPGPGPVKVRDWREVAASAGRHGVRYRTNAALEAFLAEALIHLGPKEPRRG